MARKNNAHKAFGALLLTMVLAISLAACSARDRDGQQEETSPGTAAEQDNAQNAQEQASTDMTGVSSGWTGETGWQGETAADGQVDLAAMQALNPDIFGWIYVPGTRVDFPLCQSMDDTRYESVNALGEADAAGAVYIELANLPDMCDFNEVLHGAAAAEKDPFTDLAWFLEPAFFDTHREAYIYLDGNKLTYELFAAYRRENTSLLRLYNFTEEEGCRKFITDLMMNRDMSTMFRTGYEDINPNNFLITLTGHVDGKASEGNEISARIAQGENGLTAAGEQIVVLGVLTGDEAGTIDRTTTDQYYELLDN